MHSQKNELRKLMKSILMKLNKNEKERQSELIQNYLVTKCKHFKNARHIGLYISQNEQEIDTSFIIRAILTTFKTTKSVYVPHVDFKSGTMNNEMKFYQIKSLDQYDNEMSANNKWKIKQFISTADLVEIDPNNLDLIIVPAMAFSFENGGFSRLGRGKGYYDRFLEKIPNCYSIGLAFNEQLIPNEFVDSKVPFEKYDRFINQILCEKFNN